MSFSSIGVPYLIQFTVVLAGALISRLYMGKNAINLPYIEDLKNSEGNEVRLLHLGILDILFYALIAWLVYIVQFGSTINLWILLIYGIAARGIVALIIETTNRNGIKIKIP